MRRVVIVSDCTDVAFNEMCGVIHAQGDAMGSPIAIEPLVAVEHFSEVNASFLTRLVAETYPPGTVIYTLVSKSQNIRANHEALWGETLTGHIFIGSNFGYFGWLSRDLGVKRLYEIKDVPQSNFSGRNYIAPLVARIAANDEASGILAPCPEETIDDVAMPPGTVVHVDNFGNAKVMEKMGDATGEAVDLSLNGRFLCRSAPIQKQVYLQPERGRVVMYPSTSFDYMTDIAMVRGNFAQHHGVTVGDVISW